MAILRKQSLVDQIYDQIRSEIINLQVPLGSRLNVSELQERYGGSSTPIREAINRLQKEGLVELMAAEIHQEIEDYKAARDYKVKTMCVHNIVGTFYKYCGNSRLDSNMGVIKGLQLILRNIYGRAVYGDEQNTSQDNAADFSAVEAAVLQGDTEGIIRTLEENDKKATPVIVKAVEETA